MDLRLTGDSTYHWLPERLKVKMSCLWVVEEFDTELCRAAAAVGAKSALQGDRACGSQGKR